MMLARLAHGRRCWSECWRSRPGTPHSRRAFEDAAQELHGPARRCEAVQEHHPFPTHRREIPLTLDRFQLGETFRKGPRDVCIPVVVQQPALPGDDVLLDSPLMEKELIAPGDDAIQPLDRDGTARRPGDRRS